MKAIYEQNYKIKDKITIQSMSRVVFYYHQKKGGDSL